MTHRLVLIAAVMLCAGCGSNNTPTSPTTSSTVTTSSVSPVGSWSGAISDPISGDGTAQLSLSTQAATSLAPEALTGTWSVTFKNGDRLSGPAVAVLIAPPGYGITLYADPPPSCAGSGSTLLGFTAINVAVTPNRLTAVMVRMPCNGPDFTRFGSLSLVKQ